jgi:hypothetical protein
VWGRVVRNWLVAGLGCVAVGLGTGLWAGSWRSGLAGGLLAALVLLHATLQAQNAPPGDLP